jgi:hypothetical protein
MMSKNFPKYFSKTFMPMILHNIWCPVPFGNAKTYQSINLRLGIFQAATVVHP